jgi:hypothetical protein
MNQLKRSDYKKGGKDYYSRRIGKDGSKLSTDIHVYRWFWCFLKLTKELEDNKEKLEINKKSYLVKINRSHNWFKLINVDKFSKSKNINTGEIDKFYGKVKKLFNQDFFPKHRQLFLEPTSKEINSIEELHKINLNNYKIIIFPIENSHRRNIKDLNIINKNSKDKKSYGYKPITRAKISIKGRDDILKRLFHTFRVIYNEEKSSKAHKKSLSNFELYNLLQTQLKTSGKLEVKDELLNKHDDHVVIDRIRSQNRYDDLADNFKGKIIQKKKLIMRKYPYKEFSKELKNFSRDYRRAKILIINLCKGKFPNFNKIIS